MFEVGELVVRNPNVSDEELDRLNVTPENDCAAWYFDNPVMVVRQVMAYEFSGVEIMVHPVGKESDVLSLDDHMVLPVDMIKEDLQKMKEEIGV